MTKENLYQKFLKDTNQNIEEYHDNKYMDWLEDLIASTNQQLILSSVRLSLDFAEWIDIYCIRDGEHEWKYKGDNYTKKHSTQEMFNEWQRLLTNEA